MFLESPGSSYEAGNENTPVPPPLMPSLPALIRSPTATGGRPTPGTTPEASLPDVW